jgi:hypothetical protein
MKRKKKRDDLRNTLTQRQEAIVSGDRLLTRAEFLAAASAVDAKRGRQKLREAALFYEGAARAFQRATLGLTAKASWGHARQCYEQLSDAKCATMCREHQESIEDIWTDGANEQA